MLSDLDSLGAGFQLASHDLDIRGAGNLLGDEQSGHIREVGFELYQSMLEDAILAAKAGAAGLAAKAETVSPQITVDAPIMIPDDYVPDVHQRLDLYKRLSAARSGDALEDLRSEMVDRFGAVPDEVVHLFRVMEVKQALAERRFRALDHGPERLVVTLGPTARIDPGALARLVAESERSTPGRLRLTPELKLVARVPRGTDGDGWAEAALALLDELAGCAP